MAYGTVFRRGGAPADTAASHGYRLPCACGHTALHDKVRKNGNKYIPVKTKEKRVALPLAGAGGRSTCTSNVRVQSSEYG